MRIGDILLKAGLINAAQLDEALRRQGSSRQRLGQVLAAMGACTQEQIDQSWLAMIVTPALEAAIDRASFNGFSRRAQRSIVFKVAKRRTMVVEDLLSGAVEVENEIAIDGTALVTVDGNTTIELHFTHDPMLSFAELQDDDDERIRAWLGMGAASATIADRIAQAAAMLKASNAGVSNTSLLSLSENTQAMPEPIAEAA